MPSLLASHRKLDRLRPSYLHLVPGCSATDTIGSQLHMHSVLRCRPLPQLDAGCRKRDNSGSSCQCVNPCVKTVNVETPAENINTKSPSKLRSVGRETLDWTRLLARRIISDSAKRHCSTFSPAFCSGKQEAVPQTTNIVPYWVPDLISI